MRTATSPIVLLHGWGMRATVWNAVVAELPSLLGENHAIHTPALPGHSEAAPRPPAATLSAWADTLAATLPDDALVVGWSLGAMLAMEIARRHAHKAAGLVLIGASARFIADEHWPHGLAPATVDAFRRGFMGDPHATLKRFTALQVLGETGARGLARELAEHAALPPQADADAPAIAALQVGLDVLCSADLRASATTLRQACCILHGEADALMPVGAARWLGAQLPHASLHILHKAGHALPLSASAQCARRIAEFATATGGAHG